MNSLDDEIIEVLKNGPRSTKDLANATVANPHTVYSHCKLMEKNGILSSSLEESKKTLFFCPLTGEVLTSDNYEELMKLIKDSDEDEAVLIPFHPQVRVWYLS